MNEEILIPISLFLFLFGAFYIYFTTRNKERMAMIERGVDASLFTSSSPKSGYTLKLGLFFVGISIGVLSGYLLSSGMGMEEGVAYPSMIFLFGGIALIIFHLIEAKSSVAENQDFKEKELL